MIGVNDLRVGDMIKLGNLNRLIRAKKMSYHNSNQKMYYFYFAIQKTSWTGKCYTLYNTHDMEEKFKGLIKRNCKLAHNKMELKVQQNIFRAAYVSSNNNLPKDQIIRAEEMAGKVP